MKFLKKIGLFFIIFLIQTNIVLPDQLSDKDANELKVFTKNLIDQLDPNMSPEEKDALINQTVNETIKIDNYIKSLPESERKKVEQEMEEAVSHLLSDESPVKDLFKDKDSAESPIVVPPAIEKKEEEKTEKQKETTVCKEAQALKEILENIVSRIDSLIVKSKSMPRVSSDKQIEIKWNNSLKNSLLHFESAIKIIINHQSLLNPLVNDYKELKDSIVKFKSDFASKEIALKVPDTAGLTTLYNEDEEDNIEFETAQKKFREIITIIDKFFQKGIIDDLSDFIQDNASEDLKKDPKFEKELDQLKQTASKSDFQGPTQRRQYSAPTYSGADYSYNYPNPSGSYYPASSSNYPTNIIPDAKDKNSPKDTKQNSKLANELQDKPDKKKNKSSSEEKKSSPDKDEKKNDKLNSTLAIDKQLDEARKEFSSLSTLYEKIGSLTDKLNDSDQIGQLDVRDFDTNLTELDIKYDRLSKTLSRLKGNLKNLQQDTKEIYQNAVKGIYCKSDLKLEKNYQKLTDLTENDQLPKKSIAKVKELIKAHNEFKNNLDMKDDKIQGVKSDSDISDELGKSDSPVYFNSQLSDINQAFENLSTSYDKTISDKSLSNLNDLLNNHIKTTELINKSGGVQKEVFKDAIRGIYCDSNLETQHNKLTKEESPSKSSDAKLFKKVSESHEELKKSFDF